MSRLELAEAAPDDAAEVLAVITAAFGARPALDPPSTALTETVSSVAATLAGSGGVLVRRDGRPVGLQPVTITTGGDVVTTEYLELPPSR